MTRKPGKPHLILIRGGASSLGPISRMGLWDRFASPARGHWYLFAFAKALLVTALIYCCVR